MKNTEIDTSWTFTNTVTLADFIRKNELQVGASGNLSSVILRIALATKIVSRGVNRAGLASMMGLAGEVNVQGEEQAKLDIYADKVFSSTLGRSGYFLSMVSEEREELWPAKKGSETSHYVIAFDPVDGSSNIDVNVSIGTVWGIYRRISDGSNVDPNDTSDFLQPGKNQVAAGYTIYGSSTMFVYSTGHGTHGFTLDPTIGEFILTNPQMEMPQDGNIYSCNEGNYHGWSEGVKQYVDTLKDPSKHASGNTHSARYVGSLVADFHRTVLKGGIFMYPGDKKNPNGKLRLLYECAPMAFLAENSGGRASNGNSSISDLVPTDIHARTPLFIGSTKMVEEVEKSIREHGGD